MEEPDVVIVGGGISGGALATVLALRGMSVLLLERQLAFRDQVRGEIMWPWGVRVMRQLGLEQTLRDAGAQLVRRFDFYDEGALDPEAVDVAGAVAGVEGSLNIHHPHACAAFIDAARRAGADVRIGARDVVVSGAHALVRWSDGSRMEHEVRCRLIVGADGRRSSVRAQAGIPLEVDPPAHLIAGMLVEDVPGMDRGVNVMARESDLIFYSFPQQDGRSRLYFSFPNGQRSRFSGNDGGARFLAETKLACLRGVAEWESAKEAGPCATFAGQDSRAPHPLAEGIVLIGDAAGYENPLQGQGLAMAMQDVSDVAEALLAAPLRSPDLTAYAARRATRQRLANVGTALEVWLNEGCVAQNPSERAARTEFIAGDDVLSELQVCFMTGFDALPQDLTLADLTGLLAAYQRS